MRLSLAKHKIKILLLEGIHPLATECLRADGYTDIQNISAAIEPEKLSEYIKDVHIIGIRSHTRLTEALLKQANRLFAIGCFCIGTNQVDLKAASALGIPVFNAPFSNTRSVAEMILGEMIMLLRDIPRKNAQMHRGEWKKSAAHSHEMRGKTLGIIGYGHIGSQLGILAETLGMRVCFYDIESKLALGNAKAVNFQTLLESADVVSLHVPATAQTQHLMNAQAMAMMKPKSILLNASRGQVVDLGALENALREGHIYGAAIDVFPIEPKSNQDAFSSTLQTFDNVLLTPHIGGSTEEAQHSIGEEVASKLLRYSNNGSTVTAVNFPEVTLPEHKACSRVMHIHRNEPGMLKQINAILASADINVSAQYLQTRDQLGYVVMDLDNSASLQLLDELKAIPGTLRTRVLHD